MSAHSTVVLRSRSSRLLAKSRHKRYRVGVGELITRSPSCRLTASVGQWAIDKLGMSDGGPGYVEGTGQPIPDAWRTEPSELVS